MTATSGGFVAVGLAGPANAQHAVEWTSPDGLTWSAATPLASAGTSEITALTDSGAVAHRHRPAGHRPVGADHPRPVSKVLTIAPGKLR